MHSELAWLRELGEMEGDFSYGWYLAEERPVHRARSLVAELRVLPWTMILLRIQAVNLPGVCPR